MTDKSVLDWRKAGKHLPSFIRDFHDQKDLFKAMYDTTDVQKHEYTKDIDWIAGHCYIIDIFLWFMARHGYTLQKTNKKLPFDDITKTVEDCRVARRKAMSDIFRKKE